MGLILTSRPILMKLTEVQKSQTKFGMLSPNVLPPSLKYCHANLVMHSINRETISKYQVLANDPKTSEIWVTAFGKKIESLVHDDVKTNTHIFDIILFLSYDDIMVIPSDNDTTYVKVVVNYCLQKAVPNWVRVTFWQPHHVS